MDFCLSEEQQLLADTLGRFLGQNLPPTRVREIAASESGSDPAVWNSIAQLGVAGMLIPEEHDGNGQTLLDAVVAAEMFGYHCSPVPFLSTVMATVALARGGSKEQKETWFPRIARGDAGLGVAASERVARREGAGVRVTNGRLNGKSLFAIDSTSSSAFLVATDDARIALVAANARGLQIEPLSTIDGTRRFSELNFDNVDVDSWVGDDIPLLVDTMLDAGRLVLAADILGASQRALDLAVAYAGERKQFDRIIGSFQAVKHLCAEMAAEIEPARSLLWYGGHVFDAVPEEAPFIAAHAKAHLSEVGRFVVRMATEVHGGIGFTEECDVQLYFKRVGVNRSLLGSPEQIRERGAQLQGWIHA